MSTAEDEFSSAFSFAFDISSIDPSSYDQLPIIGGPVIATVVDSTFPS